MRCCAGRGSGPGGTRWPRTPGRRWPGLPGLLRDELGVDVSAAASQEAHDTARLLGGTRYRAFSPSDTCPDNNLVTSHGVRFVDFEWGCFRDVVLDAAYFRVPFPGCEASFALPQGMAEAMLVAWRDEIAAVWPDLDEPERLERRLHRRPAAVGPGCAPGGCCRGSGPGTCRSARTPPGPRGSAPPSGTTGGSWCRRRPRPGCTATAELGSTVAAALAERFPDAPAALPIFPAFRSGVLTS